MKGGIVCFIIAYKALLSLGFKPAAPLYFHAVIEEECTGTPASRPRWGPCGPRTTQR